MPSFKRSRPSIGSMKNVNGQQRIKAETWRFILSLSTIFSEEMASVPLYRHQETDREKRGVPR